MEKLVYVVWAPGDPEALLERLRGPLASRLRSAGAGRLALSLVDAEAKRVQQARITRLDPPPAGIVCLWPASPEAPAACTSVLGEACARLAGYRVTESVALENTTQRAPLGARTPGINMVALLERPERLDREAWIARWHGPHRAVALETQCTFGYVRNVVEEAVTPDAPPWRGIVEEHFPADAVTDPMKWYRADGDPAVLKANLDRMLESCRAFLDLDRVESHPTSEYRLSD